MTTPDPTRVRDALRGDAPVIEGLATVTEALKIMEDRTRRALIIDKRDEADEYGLITVNHIAEHVFAVNRNPDRVSVYEIMEKPALHLLASMRTRYAIRLMCRLKVEHAIVTEADHVIGCVSLRDLSMAEMHSREEAGKPLA